jgi:hypothetical protein
MLEAIDAFLASLTRQQREAACIPFDDHAERTDWAFYPRRERGVALAELNHRQRKLAVRLLATGLSRQAFASAVAIMALDDLLDEIEGHRLTAWRDPALFYVTVFVETRGLFEPPRGWRFEGHHISVNYTLGEDGIVASSPLFLGANPARVRHEGADVLRPLGQAEDRARELLESLDARQRAQAIVHDVAPAEMLLANLPFPADSASAMGLPVVRNLLDRGVPTGPFAAMRFDPAQPRGIAAESLTPGQRELLGALVAVYRDRYPEGAALEGMSELDGLHFGWAGPAEVGAPHYYRLQGPRLIVEYDNTQNGANHVHTVCRHPRNDFGADALALHYLADHQAR